MTDEPTVPISVDIGNISYLHFTVVYLSYLFSKHLFEAFLFLAPFIFRVRTYVYHAIEVGQVVHWTEKKIEYCKKKSAARVQKKPFRNTFLKNNLPAASLARTDTRRVPWNGLFFSFKFLICEFVDRE